MVVGTMGAISAFGGPVVWTSFTSATSTQALGTLNGSAVTITAASGIVPGSSSFGPSSLWACGATCTATYANSGLSVTTGGAANASLLAIQAATTYTISVAPGLFGPVYLAFMSLGQGGVPVTYTYTGLTGGTLQSGGAGSFGGSAITVTSNSVSGTEGNGWASFANSGSGALTSFSFTSSAAEFYGGIQIGTMTPEPGTMALLGGGLALLAGIRLRKRS